MTRIRNVKGKIIETTGGRDISYAKESIVFNSATTISFTAKEGISFGEPMSPQKKDTIMSEYKFESTYIYDHLLGTAKEILPKFNSDDTSIIFKFYKALDNKQIKNPEFLISRNLLSGKPFYDSEEKKIIIWETSLQGIERSQDRKIKFLFDLTEAYGNYLNDCLKDLSPSDKFEAYEYDLFRFDAMGTENIIFANIEMPLYTGDLNLSFQENNINYRPYKKSWIPEDSNNHGPNAGSNNYYDDPVDPPGIQPNIGLKFSYSLRGGFTASLYAGISKTVKTGDFGATGALNTALTIYGKGSVGTSDMSPSLVTLSATPSLTLGYKTGNALEMNLFNNASGSGVWNSYEYAFTLGTTGILSSGKVSPEFNPDTEKFGTNPYNSHDITRDKYSDKPLGIHTKTNNTRNQIVGGAAIKVGNFMIASYNDIYKPPLFYGMGSDQYWSAGINIQAKFPQDIKLAYAVDMYYGKSNNKNPYNLDKVFDKQNYDYQQLFDVLLNRGQETFTVTDAMGNVDIKTKYGYGTFWPTNMMHDSISFPEKPIKPKKPEPKDFKNITEYEKAKIVYEQSLDKYNKDKVNYEISIYLKPKPTFHHLYVVYDSDNKVVFERLQKYLHAGQSEEGKLLKEYYLLQEKK